MTVARAPDLPTWYAGESLNGRFPLRDYDGRGNASDLLFRRHLHQSLPTRYHYSADAVRRSCKESEIRKVAGQVQKDAATIPPYLPWKTFRAFVEKLSKTAVPDRIDLSLLKNLSGTVQGQLLNGLKFLDLTNGDGATTERLKKLAETCGTPEWSSALREVLQGSYKALVGSLDLEKATPGQLKERFRDVGRIEGDTIEKAIRFYLNGLKEAEVNYSPHLKVRQRAPRGSGQRHRSKGTGGGAEAGNAEEESELPLISEGTIKLPFRLPGKPLTTVILAEGISETEWSMIDDYVRNYIKLSAGKDEN